MRFAYDPKLIPNARGLRKQMTDEEKHLWYDFLRQLPVTVNRQKVIGKYIVDFFIASSRLVIEVDGRQHQAAENKVNDEKRDRFMESMGFRVMRFSNEEIHKNFSLVCDRILETIGISREQMK